MQEVMEMPIPEFQKRWIEGRMRAEEANVMESLHLQRLAANLTPMLGHLAGGFFNPVKFIIDEVIARKDRATMRRRRKRTVAAFTESFESSVAGGDTLRTAIHEYRNQEMQLTMTARLEEMIKIKTLIPTEEHVFDALPWLLPSEQDFILALDMLIDLYSKVGEVNAGSSSGSWTADTS